MLAKDKQNGTTGLRSTDRFDGGYSDPAMSGVEVDVPPGGIDLPPIRLSSQGPTGSGLRSRRRDPGEATILRNSREFEMISKGQ